MKTYILNSSALASLSVADIVANLQKKSKLKIVDIQPEHTEIFRQVIEELCKQNINFHELILDVSIPKSCAIITISSLLKGSITALSITQEEEEEIGHLDELIQKISDALGDGVLKLDTLSFDLKQEVDFSSLADALKKNCFLTNLNISQSFGFDTLRIHHLACIFEALAQSSPEHADCGAGNNHLTQLKLSNIAVPDISEEPATFDSLLALNSMLRNNTSLTSFAFEETGEGFSAEDIEIIMNGLKNNKTLKVLSFAENCLKDENIICIANNLPENLERLNLSNQIKFLGCTMEEADIELHLMTCIVAKERVKDISLWDGLIYILNYLGEHNQPLEIDFYNNIMPEEALTRTHQKNCNGDIGDELEDLRELINRNKAMIQDIKALLSSPNLEFIVSVNCEFLTNVSKPSLDKNAHFLTIWAKAREQYVKVTRDYNSQFQLT
ncbi:MULTISPECIES: hypothetical protein [Legionella]|uniref:Uncharacterized protein n=1 Tax=Legionella maceachernii TaxID=466 RepID=A0A0W0W5M0_9GAMM|nr:hypothetical protein [Legionella maceachernii]KTD27190.1 hypothetical protein Lmac_1438 [Legionella maceachernii]SKA13305.1 hypothetical protein SAMN02745128_02218 [Legionella maceachernii]SUP04758.1 Uncharacterised protein [Legionella maceachernii]